MNPLCMISKPFVSVFLDFLKILVQFAANKAGFLNDVPYCSWFIIAVSWVFYHFLVFGSVLFRLKLLWLASSVSRPCNFSLFILVRIFAVSMLSSCFLCPWTLFFTFEFIYGKFPFCFFCCLCLRTSIYILRTVRLLRAGIAQSVQGLATGWTTEGSDFESRYCQEFSLLHVVLTDSRVHPTSYSMGTGAHSPGVKQPGREADQSPPTSAEVNKK
jgi:hypothetical protein